MNQPNLLKLMILAQTIVLLVCEEDTRFPFFETDQQQIFRSFSGGSGKFTLRGANNSENNTTKTS